MPCSSVLPQRKSGPVWNLLKLVACLPFYLEVQLCLLSWFLDLCVYLKIHCLNNPFDLIFSYIYICVSSISFLTWTPFHRHYREGRHPQDGWPQCGLWWLFQLPLFHILCKYGLFTSHFFLFQRYIWLWGGWALPTCKWQR